MHLEEAEMKLSIALSALLITGFVVSSSTAQAQSVEMRIGKLD
jgi:hypothetical protein